MSSSRCLGAIVAVAALGLACNGDGHPDVLRDRPNIVLILSDDQGWSDYGFMGSEIARTPRLDALAARGVRFSLAFNTGNICRPSLLSILTGYHPAQYDARVESLRSPAGEHANPPFIRHVETLPRLLARRGYVSFQGGKYWEGSYRDGGFSEGLATRNGVVPPREPEAGSPADANGSELGRFSESALFRNAGGESLELGRSTMAPLFRFIDAHQEGPFFVWFAPLLPHTPFDASPADRAPFVEAGLTEPAVDYYANIARLDRRVGELLDHLEARGLTEKTLVVFLSDNGWTVGTPGNAQASSLGGATGKSSIHETAFRTPLIFSWPSRIDAGTDDRHVVSTVDLFATLLDLAGAELPPDRWGQSLAPLLIGTGSFDRRSVMAEVGRLRKPPGTPYPFVEDRHALFHRTLDWRYVRIEEDDSEALYSMREDPGETQNRCDQYRSLCDRMRDELVAWRRAVHVVPPVPPDFLYRPE